MHALQHTLDVREDLRQGRAPFDRILAAATGLVIPQAGGGGLSGMGGLPGGGLGGGGKIQLP